MIVDVKVTVLIDLRDILESFWSGKLFECFLCLAVLAVVSISYFANIQLTLLNFRLNFATVLHPVAA